VEEWKFTNSTILKLRNNKDIKTILFADDQVLLADKDDHLHENITKLYTAEY
jgi:hypothetical protein